MLLSRRVSTAAAVLGVALLTSLSTFCGAQNTTKLSVPANIIKGASVTSGRAFYQTNLPEDTLAGIRLGRKAQDVLLKWGNPSRITVADTVTMYESNDATASTGGGMSASQFAASFPGASLGGLPGLPGAQAPAQPSSPTGTVAVLGQEEVTWTYDLNSGITLEFIITDGLVTQITVGGIGPWSMSKTRTGLQLGDTYKLVLWVCGYPESQNYVGRFLRVSYVNKNRALYTFLNNNLVGITIAMVPTYFY